MSLAKERRRQRKRWPPKREPNPLASPYKWDIARLCMNWYRNHGMPTTRPILCSSCNAPGGTLVKVGPREYRHKECMELWADHMRKTNMVGIRPVAPPSQPAQIA